MKKKITYTSDIHLDFWVPITKGDQKRKISNFIHDKFIIGSKSFTKNMWMIVAGDISHYNYQSKIFLSILSEKYEKVFFTLGNHDLYRFSRRKSLWKERMDDMKDFAEKSTNIYFLNGSSYEFDGIKIGGSMGWYDFSEGIRNGMSEEYMYYTWKRNMSDANWIKPSINPVELAKKEKEKLLSLKGCDVIVTHVPPIPIGNMLYGSNIITNSFYSFDGKEIIEKINPVLWICGHNHEPERRKVEVGSTKVVLAPLGYNNGVYAKNPFILPEEIIEL